MPLLHQHLILQICAATLEAGLAQSREGLLTGIELRFRASLPARPKLDEQILSDLDACNQAGELGDGSMPLRAWLSNALVLAGQRPQAKVFHRAHVLLGPDRRDHAPSSISPPSAVRTWNNLPPPREFFVGRKTDFEIMDGALAGVQRRVSIHGLAGVGKTALALMYAHRAAASGRYPGGVYWLGAEGDPQQAFVRLASQLEIASPPSMRAAIREAQFRDKSTTGLSQALRLVLQNHQEPSLLVLDNVDGVGWKDLAPSGEVRIVSTMRDAQWAIGVRHRLEALPPDEANELSIKIAGEPRDEDERAIQRWVIATELGGHAVAVEMASRAVELLELSWADYKQDWRNRAAAMSGDEGLHPDYPRGAFEAIDLSLDLCPSGTPRRLLEGAAVFAPEEVPAAWAAKAAGLELADWYTKDALRKLKGLGLVTVGRDGETLSIHRLVHDRLRERPEGDWSRYCERGAAVVAEWLKETVDPAKMAEIDPRRPHIDEALSAAERAGYAEAWIDIANRLATHLQYRADYPEARALFERAVQKAEAMMPPDPARVAMSLSNLALVLQDLGHAEEAHPLLDRSLEMVEKLYGADHPKVATRLSNLAAMLLAVGEAEEALPLSRRAAAILEKTYDSAHPRMAAPLSSLAAALHSVGKAEEALPISQRSLAIAAKTYGAEHPRVAPHLSTLAMVLKDLGQANRARALLEQAHQIAERTYGPDHPKVAATLSNLAEVMLALERTEEARVLIERALKIDEGAYGAEHPRVAQRRSILARVAGTGPLRALNVQAPPSVGIQEDSYDAIGEMPPPSMDANALSSWMGAQSNVASVWRGRAVARVPERRAILFLGANPSDDTRIEHEASLDDIRRQLHKTPYGSEFRLIDAWAPRTQDMEVCIQRYRPVLVHFSGNGSAGEHIVLEDDRGHASAIEPDKLGKLLRQLHENTRCVVLSACGSAAQAEEIARHIDCVVCAMDVSMALKPWRARAFTTAFYQALAHGKSVQLAFELARNMLSGREEADVPHLLTRPGTKPDEVYLAGIKAREPSSG